MTVADINIIYDTFMLPLQIAARLKNHAELIPHTEQVMRISCDHKNIKIGACTSLSKSSLLQMLCCQTLKDNGFNPDYVVATDEFNRWRTTCTLYGI